MQLLIYSPTVTPRIKYIFNFIFREVLVCDFEFTSIASDFINSNYPKISYANLPLGDELFFNSTSLLTNHTIEPVEIIETFFGDQRVPFAVENSALPFDIFAASFYFLSRYEEYLPFEADEHNRFPAEKSLQHKLDILKTPVVDGWALILKNILLKKYPSLTFGKRKFTFIPTIDVDRAYHFRSSGLLKNATRILKAVANLNTERIVNIIKTGLGQADPFDTYQYLAEIHEKYELKPLFFFLLARQGHEEFDQNIHPEDEAFKDLISNVAQKAQIGIHTSYASNTETKKISEEIKTLEQIINKKVDSSRQHFLKIHLPRTYLKLIKAGINHDYSMGYASQVGFRAGTCTSFFWYDLQLEKQSHLKIHPFAVMDVTLQQYLKLNPTQAIQKIEELMASVKLVDGTFSSLW
ncbi:MAG: hypothetical protein EOO96_26815, partial [Pedobacter sp.]